MGIHATLAATITTAITDAVSAFADAASAAIISSASAAWSSPDVHHQRPLATFPHRRWRRQHLRHRGLLLHIHSCRRHQPSAAAQQGEPQSCPSRLSVPAHTPLLFARSTFASADAKVHECTISFSTTSTAAVTVPVVPVAYSARCSSIRCASPARGVCCAV